MSIESDVEGLAETLAQLPGHERLAYFKGWLANYADPSAKNSIIALWGIYQSMPGALVGGVRSRRQAIVLLHGIRTNGGWQNIAEEAFRQIPEVDVFPIGYGWYDAVRFWLPAFLGFRRGPTNRILRELRDIKAEHPDSDLVIFAHSFSTYLISQILREHTDIRLTKLLLCGSIIPTDFRWDQVKTGRDGMKVVNEVGTRDIWPVLARVTSWGYGVSGTLGFRTSRVRDRYFNYKHSDFFQPEHITKYWLEFARDGVISSSPWDSQRPPLPWVIGVGAGIFLPKITLPISIAAASITLYAFSAWAYGALLRFF